MCVGASAGGLEERGLEQVTHAREYAEALVETVRESLMVLDMDLRVRTANQSFYKNFHTGPMQTEGRLLFELADWESHAMLLRERLANVARQNKPLVDYEVELQFGGLGRKTLLLNARRIRLPAEPHPLLLLAIDDITERKSAEKELRSSESRFRRLFETAREGIWILDGSSGAILDANPFILERLGYDRQDVMGRKPWEFDLYADPQAARARFEQLKTRRFSYEAEIPMRTKAGEVIEVETISNLYEAGDHTVAQYNMRDVSERAQLQEQLRQSQKLESIGRLAGGIAHDFKNILNIISAHAALLAGKRSAGAKREESAEAIQTAVQRGSAVVRQLLTFARKSEAVLDDVCVNDVVREIVAMLEETLPGDIRVTLDLAEGLPTIKADPSQIHQALLNLFVNARDAMPEGGEIRITSARVAGRALRERLPDVTRESYVCFSVADTGVGMDETTQKHIFEPFFTTKSREAGDGLGLSVVYGVVKAHNGLIDLESQPGKGSVFRLCFPTDGGEEGSARPRKGPEEERVEVAPAAGRQAIPSGKRNRRQVPFRRARETVLLVEDEELLLGAVKALLEEEGYRVLTATDGLEAVRLYEERKDIALVVSDISLPKLNGWETYRRIRQRDPGVKFIAASGAVDLEKPKEARPAGVKAALTKPYGPAEILRTVRRVLDA